MRKAVAWQGSIACLAGWRYLLALLVAVLLVACATPPASAPAPMDPAAAHPRTAARMALAQAYLQGGQPGIALQELQPLLLAEPAYAPAWTLRGLIHRMQGDVAGAEQDFRHALQLNGRDADARHNLGWLLCEQGRTDEGAHELALALAAANAAQRPRTLQAAGSCAGAGKAQGLQP